MVGSANVVSSSLLLGTSTMLTSDRLAPGIIVMQAVTIFFPIFEALKDRSQFRRTLGILEKWETSRKSDDFQSMSHNTSMTSYGDKRISTDPGPRKSEMYTMAALEKALAVNPQPLLQFAATQDFTAENIVFLMHVRKWRTEWERLTAADGSIKEANQTRLLKIALEVYTTSICATTAEFPVNIEGSIRADLERIFGPYVTEKRAPSISSFNSFDAPAVPMTTLKSVQNIMHREPSNDSGETLWDQLPSPVKPKFDPHLGTQPIETGTTTATVGGGVMKDVFDEAEASVKYLVLTNTWQKLVKAHDHLDIV